MQESISLANEVDKSWGDETNLKGFFEAMDQKRSPEQKQEIRNVVIEISTPIVVHADIRPVYVTTESKGTEERKDSDR